MLVNKYIIRFNVSVDQSSAVDVLQGTHQLNEKLEDLVSLVLDILLTYLLHYVLLQGPAISILHLNHY